MSIRRTVAMSLSLVALVVACTGGVPPEPAPTARPTAVEGPEVEPAWVVMYGGRRHYTGSVTDFFLSPDGVTAFLSGDIDAGRPACGQDFAAVANDTADGATLWTATYDGPAHWCDNVYGTALSPDATKLFVTGSSFTPGDSDITTIAYEASDGTELWVARHDGPIGSQDNGLDVVSTDKMVFVTGDVTTKCFRKASTCYTAMVTIAYDATSGNQRWLATYSVDGGPVSPAQMVVSPNGKTVFVTGVALGSAVTIAYAASTGTERWVVRDRHLASMVPQLAGVGFGDVLAISADSRTLVVAVGLGAGTRHGAAAYAATDGDKLWTLETSRSVWSWPSLVPSPTSDVVFLADEYRDDYLIVAIDATTGRALWRSTYSGACDEDWPTAMAVSADGSRVYVTGYSERLGGHACPEFGTIGLDAADGRRLWTNAAAYEARDIAVDDDGAVYLVGASRSHFQTFRFDPFPE